VSLSCVRIVDGAGPGNGPVSGLPRSLKQRRMCGIAGYSLSSRSGIRRTLAAQALLAGIAERGADAVGYAYRRPGETEPIVTKQRTPASRLLDRVSVDAEATELLVHVRDYTKGHPSVAANNHPVRHGPVVGIHNGIILNDDELLGPHSCSRAEPRMSVDSEAIFALAAHSGNDPAAFEALVGSMAAAWLDSREPGVVFVARGAGRPLWLGRCRHELFFASTSAALQVVERTLGLRLDTRELREGTFLALRGGRIVHSARFEPDHEYVEDKALPAVRAPQEGLSCLRRLAVLAATMS
jgi:glucosamine 6-phosphate synthetase-like amidotransferase/phosphosugar isomerase protein